MFRAAGEGDRLSMAASDKSEEVDAPAPPPPPPRLFHNCWGCRVVSGSGLIVAGGYVFAAARKVMQKGAPPSIGTVAQIVFALGLASWGVVILVDPVNKSQPQK
ncbi:distal membrane-arm assembly complex protein 1 [Heptranchias perlo]|uniref:distal membrane-arm assembly complex protein 1 n=1 Tax=Heptranchias perlo TaxID=212740 RepID=UPI00355A1C8A